MRLLGPLKRRFFTILIVRHSRARLRRLRLSYAFAGAACGCFLALAAGGMLAPGLWVELRAQSHELERLQQENEQLWSAKGYFDGALDQMSRRLGAFEEQAGRIGRELGVEDLPATRPAAGGEHVSDRTAEHYGFQSELTYLQARTESLDRSFEQLEDSFRVRIDELRATPRGLPVQGYFSHGYGWRKDPWTGAQEFHRGIDIVADAGTEIRAPAAGVVSSVGRYPDYGNSIDINHGHGFVTRYAHMSSTAVRPGDVVDRGSVLGKVGSTGRTTGPHLHYEVFRDGKRVNPWDYLEQTR